MKYKMLALILALTVISWAQTATQSTPSTPQQNAAPEKAKCACCDKMAASDSKDGHAACMHKHDGKEMASCCAGKDEKSCCSGKDAKSCMKDDKTADCCKGKEGMKCDRRAAKDCGKGCCGSDKSEKPA
jgi:hypothetical protein